MRPGIRRPSVLRHTIRLALAALTLGALAGCGGAQSREARDPVVQDAPEPPRPPFTVYRDELERMLDRGLQPLIADVRLKAVHEGPRFVGWRLQFLRPGEDPFRHSAVRPGDVLTQVNGSPLERPDQMMEVWTSLREADVLTFSVVRAGSPVDVTYAIEERPSPDEPRTAQ